ncbi:MAG: methyltransferase domain-containing protein, partial [Pseudomonadota bacterium]
MRTDVVELADFYASPIGEVAGGVVGARLAELWGDVAGQRILGFGFAAPLLERFQAAGARTISIAPAAQGVCPWPREGAGRASLCEEAHWPLPDASIDRVVLAHGLEEADSAQALLREVWRVLADDGRLVVVAPNRRGLWAQFDHTPFGRGQPYSRGQLMRLLETRLFASTAWSRCLHMPPLRARFMLRGAGAWERAGERLWPAFAGIVMVEAAKEMYAVRPAARRLSLLPSPAPARKPRSAARSSNEKARLRLLP